MDKCFKLEVSYPDSHIEEIEENFGTLEDAVAFGKTILGQIAYTERYHKRSGGGDLFEEAPKPQKPFIVVCEIVEGKRKIAFDSRRSK